MERAEPIFEVKIALICGTSFDISEFDLSFFGIRAMRIDSDEFKYYISEHSGEFDCWSSFKEILEERSPDHAGDLIIAFCPKEYSKPIDEQAIRNCHEAILLAFPSSLFVNYIFDFQSDGDGKLMPPGYSMWNGWGFDYWDNLLKTSTSEVERVNEFLKVYSNKSISHKYINRAISFYAMSFESSRIHEAYIGLVTCLETVVQGSEQLTYRLKRNVAVLVGVSRESASTIFINVGKLYTVRSKIVHGEKLDNKAVFDYLNYLRSLASRLIIELIAHNLPLDELNKRINESAFGDRDKLSKKYTELIPSSLNFSNILKALD